MCGQGYFLLGGLDFFSHFAFHSINASFIIPNSFDPAMKCLMLLFVIEAVKAFFNKLKNGTSMNLLVFVYCMSTAVC